MSHGVSFADSGATDVQSVLQLLLALVAARQHILSTSVRPLLPKHKPISPKRQGRTREKERAHLLNSNGIQ